jgi:prepilin-type processing-associated H-X9-DG protein
MKRILICLVVLLCAAVQAEAKESDDRLESVKRLRRLGNLLLVYAIDHQGKYPDSLQELESWAVDKKDLEWLLDNVEYVGQGKNTADSPGTVIAYEKALLKEGGTTNVVFLDGHVEGCSRPRLKELGLVEAKGWDTRPVDKYRLLPKPEQMSDSDGVPLYEKAVQSLPKNPRDIARWRKTPPGELPVKQVRAELKRFEPSLKLAEQAARCSKCQWPAVQIGSMPLDRYRMIAQALALQARLDIAQKKYDNAIHTMQTGLGMGRHIADGPTLIHGLVGTGDGTLVLKEAEHLIQAPDSPNL